MKILPHCLKPWYGFEIDDDQEHWGLVRPCCWGLKYGANIQTQTLDEIWNGPVFQEYRQRMLSGDTSGCCPTDCPHMNMPMGDRPAYLGMLWRRRIRNHVVNIMEIILKRTILVSRPLLLKFSPTLACNLRCIMCYQVHTPPLHLNERAMSEILLYSKTSQLLHLQGGEIFASVQGIEMLERLSRLRPQPPVGIITNGTFPTPYAWELLASLNLSWLMVSIDAASPGVYSRIRIGGEWETVIANIKRLTCLQQSIGFRLMLSFTVMSINVHEMPAMVEMAHQLECDVNFNPLTISQDASCQALCLGLDSHSQEAEQKIFLNTIQIAQELQLPMANQTATAICNIYYGNSQEK